MRGVLVLRPEPGASATVSRARELGLDAAAVPLFEVGPIDWHPPRARDFDGLLLTSANAPRLGGTNLEELRDLPVFAVGEATAQAAREAGFDIVAIGGGDVLSLLRSIEPKLNLLHLCGKHRREIECSRQAITTIPVYASNAIDAPHLGTVTGAVVLVHSPRAAARLAELVQDRGSTIIAAISAAAADAVGTGWQAVETATEPTDDALLALVACLCNKPLPE